MTTILENDSVDFEGLAVQPTSPNAGRYKFYIDNAGQAYVVNAAGTATAVSPAGIDGAGANAGQLWTADGAGASWQTLVQNPSLSDYSNVIVVDAGGNGDYTTVEAAIAAEPSGSTIFVFGNVTESSFLLFGVSVGGLDKKFTIHVTPGSVWTIPDGAYVGYDLSISCIGDGKVIVNTESIIAYDGIFELTNAWIIATGTGVEPVSLEPQTSLTPIIANCKLEAPAITTFALRTGGTIGNMGSGARVSYSTLIGRIGGTAWANAPIYHCDITGTVATNITVTTGNYTNTLNGVTWPTIP